ncbi:MAG TPA: hypothetical protein GX707_06300, partial [Epulopiscium sp.]|nr:hypothetical protein [Candidatus Epulonipiscium sp.]
MKKRIIASTLALMLCLSLLPYEVFANLQSPIQGISVDSIVGHTKEMDQIRPKVELMFAQPIPSIQDDTTSGSVNGTELHGLKDYYYQVDIKEHPTGKSFKYPESPRQLKEGWGIEPEPAENTLTNGIPVQGLDNGRLYKMSIIPSHYHQYKDSEGNRLPDNWAPRTGVAHPFEYVLTDFDTRMEGKGGSIEVTWEDAGSADIDYQIGYIQGNYEGQSLNQIKNNNTVNNINYISPGDIKTHAKPYRDPQTKRTRFRYTIEDDIAVGQMYSAYVVSTTERIDNKIILKNRETPKVVTATTEIGLNVYNVGKDKIRLEWDPKLFHVTDGEYNLVQTQIKEYNVGQESGRVIATLYGKDGVDIGYYEYREPKISTYYQLILIYEHKATGQPLKPEPQTARVLYVPGELRTKPTTPEIPKPIGPNTTVTADNKGEFLVPGDLLPDVPLVDLWKNNHTFHVNMVTPPNINFVWSAYKEDLSLLYDIWVTDDLKIAQSDAVPIISDLSFTNEQNKEDILYNKDKEEVVGFRHTIGEYYDSQMQKRPLVPNRVYYVKILAKKKYGDELEPSLPAIVAIMFNSDGEIFAPPIISKPPLKIEPESISSTSITIEWLETWYEIMAKDPDEEQEKAKEWNAKVYTGVTTGPAISFVHREGAREHILKREQNIGILKNIIGTKKYNDDYIDRVVNLGKNVEYEYKFTPYEEILEGLKSYNVTTIDEKTIEEYIEMLMRDETDPNQDYGWRKITPKTAEDDEYTQWKQHTQGSLKPNTSYVFFIKP